MLTVVATTPVWVALARTTTYEPGSYVPLSGFAASHHTWLLLVVACLGVMAVRRRWFVGGVPASVVVVRLAIAGATPPDPPQVGPVDCAGMNIPIGCQLGNALSALTPTRSIAELRMPLNVATAGSIAMLVAILGWPRARSSDVT